MAHRGQARELEWCIGKRTSLDAMTIYSFPPTLCTNSTIALMNPSGFSSAI